MTSTNSLRITLYVYAGLILLGFIAPFFVYPMILMKIYVFALFGMAFNLLFGYAGLLSFGHVVFFGTAAYATGHSVKVWGLSPELGILYGVLLGTILAAVVGAFAIRRAGIYFAMITFALVEVGHFVAMKVPLTGGENGLTQVPRGVLFGIFDLTSPLVMYFFVFAVFVLAFLMIVRIVGSPFGLALRSMKENESRAISLGYSPPRLKFQAFVLSGLLAALAGSMKVMVYEFASLSDVHWLTNGQVILMTLLGGVGTFLGPLFGSVVVVFIEDYMSFLGQSVTIVTGGIFIVCIIGFRRGLVGEMPFIYAKLRNRFAPGDKTLPTTKTNAADTNS